MCLAIFKPAKVSVPADYLREGWIHNPDGAGFAYTHKGKVHTVKGLMTWKAFIEAYDVATKKFKNSPFVIHFRIRSMGDKSAENTHPFPIRDGVLIHNGSVDGTKAVWDKGPSDTAYFAETFSEKLTYDFVKEHKKEWDDAVGYNKMVMLYDDGRHLILNEQHGSWVNDVWYSNMSYKPRPLAAPYNGGNHHPYGASYD